MLKYHDLKPGFDILVKVPEATFVSKTGGIDLLKIIISITPVFGINPIDDKNVQLDFGTPPVFKMVKEDYE